MTPSPEAKTMTEERWQLVPVELTQAMLDATCGTEEDDAAMRATWAELLRAAPSPTPAADEVAGRLRRYLDERAKMGGIDLEAINTLQSGTARECALLVYDIEAAIAALQAKANG